MKDRNICCRNNSDLKSENNDLLSESQVRKEYSPNSQDRLVICHPQKDKKEEYETLFKKVSGDFNDLFNVIKSPNLSSISKKSSVIDYRNDGSFNYSIMKTPREKRSSEKIVDFTSENNRLPDQQDSKPKDIACQINFRNSAINYKHAQANLLAGQVSDTFFESEKDQAPVRRSECVIVNQRNFKLIKPNILEERLLRKSAAIPQKQKFTFKRKSILRNTMKRNENYLMRHSQGENNIAGLNIASNNKLRSASNIPYLLNGGNAPRLLVKSVTDGTQTLPRTSTKSRSRISIRKINDMDPKVFIDSINKSEEKTEYGKICKLYKIVDFVLVALVITNIAMSLIDNELYYTETDKYVSKYIEDNKLSKLDEQVYTYMMTRQLTESENFFRFVNVILVACIEFLLFLRYSILLRLLRIDGRLTLYDGFYQSGYLIPMILEMLLCILVYPPFMNNVIHGKMLGQDYAYSINSLITIAVSLKSYVIIRGYQHFSRWTSNTANSICHEWGISGGIHFAIKAELKKRPYTMLFILIVSCIVIFAFTLRTFEYYVSTQEGSFQLKVENVEDMRIGKIIVSPLQSFTTCAWLTIITMTTVGYGDYVPRSHFGRFVVVVSCVLGLVLLSLLVVALAIVSQFSLNEKKAYSILKKLNANNNATGKAHQVLCTFLRLRKMIINQSHYKISERFIGITQLKKAVSDFKNEFKYAKSLTIPQDQMYIMINDNIRGNFETLCSIIEKMRNIDSCFCKIKDEQNQFMEKMKMIQSRHIKIAGYLIKFNNEQFKHSLTSLKKEGKLQENLALKKKEERHLRQVKFNNL